jgi:hypothetical protein
MRPVRTAAVVLVSIAALLAADIPASAGGIPRGRSAIGDSVMLGAAQELRAKRIHVNATVSRQFSSLPHLLRQLRRRGDLRATVIIHLGNNGFIELDDCKRAVKAAVGRKVFLVTVKVPRRWRRANNRLLQRCDRRFASAHLIDWFSYSVNHPSWFADDLYHLTARGQRRYAAFVAKNSR